LHGRHLETIETQQGCTWQWWVWRQSGARVTFLVNESREVMNVRQASQYLGISPDTLYRYITEGEIPAFKLGNRWKLRKTILDRWMERKMSQAHARRR
jgi:excisionase family DNA binding protein